MTRPTDAELAALAVEINRTDWDDAMDALICFARTVLARWGQPAHSGEPVAWLDPWTGAKATTDYDAYGKHGIPLYTAPQPTQAQAGAVPLTQAKVVEAFCKQPHPVQFVTAFDQGVRFAERHHGIKGGRHVGNVD